MRVDLQPAYILHARPYRDTSLLLDLLSPEHGRITAVARGGRTSKAKRQGASRQGFHPFQRLLVNWQGKSNFKLVTACEADAAPLALQGRALYAGFYLNELLVYLLPEQDVIADLFARYDWTLAQLQQGSALEPLLREFEFLLLQGLGYGLDFTSDCHSGQPLNASEFYLCDTQQGFYAAPAGSDPRWHLPGYQLLAIARGDYCHADTCRIAKYLSRQLLRPLLGGRRLKSRDLFINSPAPLTPISGADK